MLGKALRKRNKLKVLIDLQGAQGFGAGRGIGRYFELSRAMFELEKMNLSYFFDKFVHQGKFRQTISYLREFASKNIKGFFVPEAEDFRVNSWRRKQS